MKMTRRKISVIGGGFFGMYIAEYFALTNNDVLLLERTPEFMNRASYNNQARVHNGYHYPRSILTALRCSVAFPRFVKEFRDCIDFDFEKYYMIGSPLSKISAGQFKKFCERIGAPCEVAPERIRRLTNPHFVEACFSTIEYAFDARVLRDIMLRRIESASVRYRLSTSVEKVCRRADRLILTLRSMDLSIDEVEADIVFNCTYSNTNYALINSEIAPIPLKHELTEMCLVEVPDEIKRVGITVMCGPFFSVMPFPPLGLHSFSHVRYTPHDEWVDKQDPTGDDVKFFDPVPRKSAWVHIYKDAARYIPILKECRYKTSLWEVKTVLPRSETDDSRPILFRTNHGLPGLHCILGGKIDNVYDVISSIESREIAATAEGCVL